MAQPCANLADFRICLFQLATSEDAVDRLTNQFRDAERQRKDAEFNGRDALSRLEDKKRALKDAEKKINSLKAEVSMTFCDPRRQVCCVGFALSTVRLWPYATRFVWMAAV